MKRIVCLSDRLGFRGGAERQLSGLTFFLKQKGYDVQAVTYLKQSHPSVLEMNFGMKYHCLDATNIFSKLLKVGSYIKKNKTEVVIAYKNGPTKLCCILKMLGFKFCLIASERNTTQNITFAEKVKFFLYRFADYIVPNSYAQEKFIVNNFPHLADKVKTIVNYVEADKFVPIEYNESDDDTVRKCVVVASIKKQKNPINLIKAAKLMKDQKMNVHIDWIGSSNDETLNEECKTLIKELAVENYICFKPASPEVHKEYPKYDFFCLPSYFEGFPNTLCEAMSCGLPVVASAICDNPYILKNGEYGILFKPELPEEMADAFARIIKRSKDELQSQGRVNRERIIRVCSSEAFVNQYINIIENKNNNGKKEEGFNSIPQSDCVWLQS